LLVVTTRDVVLGFAGDLGLLVAEYKGPQSVSAGSIPGFEI
jgi:hypothetical protein